MLALVAIAAIFIALLLLLALSLIDLKTYLLPNELVMGVLVCGVIFHAATIFHYGDFISMALGGFIGAALLYVLREVTGYIYKVETLGLGDVKLMGAVGVWVGADYILPAITVGALCGVLHGIVMAFYIKYKSGMFPHMGSMMMPAGPGFAAGSVLVGAYMLRNFPQYVWHEWGI